MHIYFNFFVSFVIEWKHRQLFTSECVSLFIFFSPSISKIKFLFRIEKKKIVYRTSQHNWQTTTANCWLTPISINISIYTLTQCLRPSTVKWPLLSFSCSLSLFFHFSLSLFRISFNRMTSSNTFSLFYFQYIFCLSSHNLTCCLFVFFSQKLFSFDWHQCIFTAFSDSSESVCLWFLWNFNETKLKSVFFLKLCWLKINMLNEME